MPQCRPQARFPHPSGRRSQRSPRSYFLLCLPQHFAGTVELDESVVVQHAGFASLGTVRIEMNREINMHALCDMRILVHV